MNEKEIVKYNNKWWVLERVSDSGMAILWRDGKPLLIPTKLIEYQKSNN